MLTIDEYIAKMKKADKMNEFDFLRRSENMSSVMKYVMNYFNEYLSMETCDAEEIKIKHAVDKLEEDTAKKYPRSKDFITSFYMQHRIRIYREIEKWLEDEEYFHFYYSEEDFLSLANKFCAEYKLKNGDMTNYQNEVAILLSEIKKDKTEKPSPSDMIHLDNTLVTWVRQTYRQYGVNLFEFASRLSSKYYERYVKYERVNFREERYRVNTYNHRYNTNPFDIDEIYEDIKDRPFMQNRRGELEMLVMHEWLFNEVYDDDYWPEYVNLCVTRGRVSIVKNVNVLIPVRSNNLNYPDDAPCQVEHVVTSDGMLKKAMNGAYILRIDAAQSLNNIWQNNEEMARLLTTLNKTFNEHGIPSVLEFTAPINNASFDDETFYSCCSLLERKMKSYSHLKIAIVNGTVNQKSKPPSYMSSIEDIFRVKAQFRERKIHLQFSIDFPMQSGSRRNTYYNSHEMFRVLTEMKNSIICLNVAYERPQISCRHRSREINDDLDVYYLDKYKYPQYDDFYSSLSATFNDNQHRYLIPKNISNDGELERLIDNLLRSGFAFCGGGNQHE